MNFKFVGHDVFSVCVVVYLSLLCYRTFRTVLCTLFSCSCTYQTDSTLNSVSPTALNILPYQTLYVQILLFHCCCPSCCFQMLTIVVTQNFWRMTVTVLLSNFYYFDAVSSSFTCMHLILFVMSNMYCAHCVSIIINNLCACWLVWFSSSSTCPCLINILF